MLTLRGCGRRVTGNNPLYRLLPCYPTRPKHFVI
nr:MAG TPA: LydA-holin antagonist [Caudoviricetes sp.]